MKNLRFAIPIALALSMPMLAQAQGVPGRHPAYLHALTDLHDARWFLDHGPEGYPMDERERRAVEQIDHAMDEVRRAAYYDGKDAYDRPREGAYPDARGRLRRVSELLRRARADVAMPEDNLNVRDFQYHAVERIDNAIRLAEGVMLDRERPRDYDRR